MFIIEEELKKLPKKPGVYLMKDKDDKIIYVGKAINLKNRVSSYFRKTETSGVLSIFLLRLLFQRLVRKRGKKVNLTKSQKIEIPKYTGVFNFKYAKNAK